MSNESKIDKDTANAESAEAKPRLSNGEIDDALEAAYTLNWYLNEAWGNPEQKENAQKAQLNVLNILTGGAYGKSTTPEAIPAPSNIGDLPKMKIAVVVGHNSRNKGAFMKGAFNQFEFDFNNRVADLMIESAEGSDLQIKKFNRTYVGSYTTEVKRVYENVNAWDPDFIFELHFNGYNGKTGYSFVLHHHASSKGKACAKHINDVFVAETGFTDKETKALTSSDRGYLSTAEASAPCILTETWFGDYADHVEKIGQLDHEGVAALYMDAIPGIGKILGIK